MQYFVTIILFYYYWAHFFILTCPTDKCHSNRLLISAKEGKIWTLNWPHNNDTIIDIKKSSILKQTVNNKLSNGEELLDGRHIKQIEAAKQQSACPAKISKKAICRAQSNNYCKLYNSVNKIHFAVAVSAQFVNNCWKRTPGTITNLLND